MTISDADSDLAALNQRIVDVEVWIGSFQRLLDKGALPPTDELHLARARRLLEELYAQRGAMRTRWRAKRDSPRE